MRFPLTHRTTVRRQQTRRPRRHNSQQFHQFRRLPIGEVRHDDGTINIKYREYNPWLPCAVFEHRQARQPSRYLDILRVEIFFQKIFGRLAETARIHSTGLLADDNFSRKRDFRLESSAVFGLGASLPAPPKHRPPINGRAETSATPPRGTATTEMCSQPTTTRNERKTVRRTQFYARSLPVRSLSRCSFRVRFRSFHAVSTTSVRRQQVNL